TTLFAGASVGLIILASASAASAQSIDYGAMEQLFNEPVTTSATGSPQRATEAPVDMTIISASDIKRSGAGDLPTILSRVAGVDVLNFAAGQSDVGIRGYNQARSPRLLVLINGRQVYLDHFGYTDWASLPIELSEIRQIEVVRGPNSAIFGFNAVSGVVNIITFNPKFDNTNVIELRAGTGESTSVSAVKTVRLGERLSVRFSGGVDHENEWQNTTTGTGRVLGSQIHNPSTARANIDAVAQLNDKTTLRVEGSMSNGASSQVISTFAYAAHRVKTNALKATLNADTKYGLLQAQAYRNDLDALTPGRRYLNNITVYSLEDLFKIGAAHTIRLGVEYRDNQLDTASYAGAKVSYKVLAPSAMWNWVVSPKLALTAAARVDKLSLKRTGPFPVGAPQHDNGLWSRDITEPSINLGAVYKVSDSGSLRATYARGVQAPTLLELGGLLIPPATAAPTGFLITGNPLLEPAIVTNYQLGYSQELPALKARASLKVFTQETKSVKGQFSTSAVDFAATPSTWMTATYKNVSDSKMNGVELAASGKLDGGFHWNADTTYTDVTDKPFTTLSSIILRKVDFEATSPKYRSNLAAGWSNDKWSADGYAHLVSKFSSYNGNLLEPVKGYTTVGGRVAYTICEGTDLALNGQNLLTDRQSQAKGASGLQAERRVMIGISKSW
ncbi:MAG: TonB-dependent receptor, partial [Alphaproteobacteria bacterium]|nr:TonB-dependent receptor [Alphaproteobacteria bacterium]